MNRAFAEMHADETPTPRYQPTLLTKTISQDPNAQETGVLVRREPDVATACRQARLLAETLGFSRADAYQIATATSELASNLLIHAGGGLIRVAAISDQPQHETGIELTAWDDGPGIRDLDLALTEGYSTGQGLGCGLPGVKRLMDETLIESQLGIGTCIKAVKWR